MFFLSSSESSTVRQPLQQHHRRGDYDQEEREELIRPEGHLHSQPPQQSQKRSVATNPKVVCAVEPRVVVKIPRNKLKSAKGGGDEKQKKKRKKESIAWNDQLGERELAKEEEEEEWEPSLQSSVKGEKKRRKQRGWRKTTTLPGEKEEDKKVAAVCRLSITKTLPEHFRAALEAKKSKKNNPADDRSRRCIVKLQRLSGGIGQEDDEALFAESDFEDDDEDDDYNETSAFLLGRQGDMPTFGDLAALAAAAEAGISEPLEESAGKRGRRGKSSKSSRVQQQQQERLSATSESDSGRSRYHQQQSQQQRQCERRAGSRGSSKRMYCDDKIVDNGKASRNRKKILLGCADSDQERDAGFEDEDVFESAAAENRKIKISPSFCKVSQENVLCPGSTRRLSIRKRGSSIEESSSLSRARSSKRRRKEKEEEEEAESNGEEPVAAVRVEAAAAAVVADDAGKQRFVVDNGCETVDQSSSSSLTSAAPSASPVPSPTLYEPLFEPIPSLEEPSRRVGDEQQPTSSSATGSGRLQDILDMPLLEDMADSDMTALESFMAQQQQEQQQQQQEQLVTLEQARVHFGAADYSQQPSPFDDDDDDDDISGQPSECPPAVSNATPPSTCDSDSYQPPMSVLSSASTSSAEQLGGIDEMAAGITVSSLALLEQRKKKETTTSSDMAIQTVNMEEDIVISVVVEDEKNDEVEDVSDDLVQPPQSTTTMISVQSDAPSEWLFCKVNGCVFWTNKPSRMKRHGTCHRGKNSTRLKCPDCSMEFYSLAKMLKHDRKLHNPEIKDYECRQCGKEVTDIAVHMKVSIYWHSTFPVFITPFLSSGIPIF
jgi:hypothetical protein